MIWSAADRPLQHPHDVIQATGDVGVHVGSLFHDECWLDVERVVTVLPCREHWHDQRSRVAGNPHRAGWQCCLMAKKPDRLAILEEITIGQKHCAFATAQRLNDPPDPRRARLDDRHRMRATQEGHRIKEKAARCAARDGRQAISTMVQRLANEIETSEMRSDQDHAFAMRKGVLED